MRGIGNQSLELHSWLKLHVFVLKGLHRNFNPVVYRNKQTIHWMKLKIHLLEDVFSSNFIFSRTFGILIPFPVNAENSRGVN